MTSIFDKLDLRPQERRLVVIVAIVVFVVLNLWLVWPNFGALAIAQQRTRDTEKKLKTFSDEVNKKPEYERQLKALENQGLYVGSAEQALSFQKEVNSQAILSGVTVSRYDPGAHAAGGRTNSFFEEQTLLITVTTGEKELIDFLYNLGARNSLIRVRSMMLGRDPTQTKLQGTITLVESFQRKAPARPAAIVASAASTPTQTNQPVKGTNKPPKSAVSPVPATNQPPKLTLPMSKATNAAPAKGTNGLPKFERPRRFGPPAADQK